MTDGRFVAPDSPKKQKSAEVSKKESRFVAPDLPKKR